MRPVKPEHPFAHYVRILAKGKRASRSLTEAEAYEAMAMILAGEVEPEQLGAFMMLLRVKEETADELLGFAKATRESLNLPAVLPKVDLDWPSYAGKKNHQAWYVLAALLLAQNDIHIIIHGSAGHTENRLYTEEVFDALGLGEPQTWAEFEQQLQTWNLAYCPLRLLCPPLQHIMEMRQIMGVRSPIHTLVRLINPLDAPHLLQGIFHPSYQPTHQQAAHQLGYQNVAIIKGDGGETERRPNAICKSLGVVNGQLHEESWPSILKQRQEKAKQLDPQKLVQLWRGDITDDYGVQAIQSTCALALKLLQRADSQEQALALAEQWWDERNKQLI